MLQDDNPQAEEPVLKPATADSPDPAADVSPLLAVPVRLQFISYEP